MVTPTVLAASFDQGLARASKTQWPRVVANSWGVDSSVELAFSHRVRVETLTRPWRNEQRPGTQTVAPLLLSRVRVGKQWQALSALTELQDSRAYSLDEGDFNKRTRNHLDVLQATVGVDLAHLLDIEQSIDAHFGRMTLDVTRSRLIGRNNFPNATNTFSGVHLMYRSPELGKLRWFRVSPVNRMATAADRVDSDRVIQAIAWEHYALSYGQLDAYVIDSLDTRRPVQNKDYNTLAIRWSKLKPKSLAHLRDEGSWTHDIELMAQQGDNGELKHKAAAAFIALGYTFDDIRLPHLQFDYVYASGDSAVNDGRSGAFDNLYGTRRSSFAQTSIYGPFSPSNIERLGLRFSVKPRPDVSVMLTLHQSRLVEAGGVYAGSSINGNDFRDLAGGMTRDLGTDFELIGSWQVASFWQLQAGLSYWNKGQFLAQMAKQYATFPDGGDRPTLYGFMQSEWRF